ncbi:MAG: hypothetical protein ACRDF4_08540 [Rhabdochlamydiaceae bacterium]
MAFVYAYKMTYDGGFAPHVKRGLLSLATCKPDIRRVIGKSSSPEGNYVLGIAGKSLAMKVKKLRKNAPDITGEIIYVAKVSEKPIDYDTYYETPRFNGRIDNIYHHVNGDWKRDKNAFHNTEQQFRDDIGGKYVILSQDFLYFGRNCIQQPDGFDVLMPTSRKYRKTDLNKEPRLHQLLNRLFAVYETVRNRESTPCLDTESTHRNCSGE